MDSSPVVGGVDGSGNVTTLFVSNKAGSVGIWKQVTNPDTDTIIGPQILVASNVMLGTRVMSVDATYTNFAFMKNVGGVSHIVVMPIAGGAEVNLGEGVEPYWSLDGSNRILFTDVDGTKLWAIYPDGTGKIQVPIPANMTAGAISKVVFAPAGF